MIVSPAKTNLFLEVPRRREDGFHELDTVFAELAVADALEVTALHDGELTLTITGAELSAGPDNLVWRAADLLRREVGRPQLGARMVLEKRIPAGGGLGGGSSNAALTLRALNQVWETGRSPAELASLAATLGSDVAFFLEGGLQRGRGRGELLEPLTPGPEPLHLVLMFPPFPCPTGRVYGALAPYLPQEPRSPRALIEALAQGDLSIVARELFNRLEQPAFELFGELPRLRDDLSARPGVLTARLSGSGSTLFALMATADAAVELAAVLTEEGHSAIATRTAWSVSSR